MTEDTSIHVTKLQFSATACLGSCPVFDIEFRRGSVAMVKPRGSWMTGYPIERQTFTGSMPTGEFDSIVSLLRRASLRESKSWVEGRVELEGDSPNYGLAVFFNDTAVVLRTNGYSLPPEFTPLIPVLDRFLKSGGKYPSLVSADTSILFQSRLCLMSNLDDSLRYLEGVNNMIYRAATFVGGDEKFQTYMRRALGPLTRNKGTFSFEVTIGPLGLVEDVRPAYWGVGLGIGAQSPVPHSYLEAIRKSPRWQIPLYAGKPIRVTRFICFYNEGQDSN
jgi:hypothetical protein